MICQECGKKQATTKIKTNINGVVNEYSLCAECAAKKGYLTNIGSPFLGFNSLLSSFFGEELGAPAISQSCPTCSATLGQISEDGKIGCSDCYDVFGSQLLPLIQRLHGNVHHMGKDPTGLGITVAPDTDLLVVNEVPDGPKSENELLIESKQNELQKAVAEENYEQAAVLRDEIKALQQGGNEA